MINSKPNLIDSIINQSLQESKIINNNSNIELKSNSLFLSSLIFADRKINIEEENIDKLKNESLYTENILNGCSNIINHNFEESLNCFRNALFISTNLNDEYKKYESTCYIGISEYYMGNFNQSLNILEPIYKEIFKKCFDEKFANDIKLLQILIKIGGNLTIVYFSLNKNYEASNVISNIISIIDKEVSPNKQLFILRNLIFILFKVNSLIQDNELESNLYNPNYDLNSNEKKDEYKIIINNLMKGFNNYLRDDNIDKWIKSLNKIYCQIEKLNDQKGLIFILFNQEAFQYLKQIELEYPSEKIINESKKKLISLIFPKSKKNTNSTNEKIINEFLNDFKEKMATTHEIYINIFNTENNLFNLVNKNNKTSFFIKLLIKYSIREIRKNIYDLNLQKKLIDQLTETLALIDNKSYDLSNLDLETLDSEISQNLYLMFENLKYIYRKNHIIKYFKKFKKNSIKPKIILDLNPWINFYNKAYNCILDGSNIIKINFSSNGKKEYFYQIDYDNDVLEIFNKNDKVGSSPRKIIEFKKIKKIIFGLKSNNLKKKHKILTNKPWCYLSIIESKKSLDWEFKNENICKTWFYGLQNYLILKKNNYKIKSTTGFIIDKLKMKMNSNSKESFVQLILKKMNS